MLIPKKINLLNKETLRIEWEDGVSYDYPVKYLRDNSPSEEENEKSRSEEKEELNESKNSKRYEIKKIEVVGNYAINIFWKEGASEGIYPFDLLRKWGKYFNVVENLHQDFEHHH